MANSSFSPIVFFVTFPSQEVAEKVAKVLIDEGVAACVNLISSVRSFFIWEGVKQEVDEVLAVVKTSHDRLELLITRVVSLHPYSTPEIIAIPIIGGEKHYLEWVRDTVSKP